MFLLQALIGLLARLSFCSLIIAHRTGTFFTQVGEVVVAAVPVGPGDIDAGAGRHVDLNAGGLSSGVERDGHGDLRPAPSRLSPTRWGG